MTNTNQDIVDIVESWRRISAGHRKDRRSYIFLDEISSVREWQKGIKWASDTGWLENCTVLATGSHTIDVRRSAERLPGRRGEVDGCHDMVLSPMRFSEFASIANDGVRDLIAGNGLMSAERRNSVFRRLASMEIDEAVDSLAAYRIDLDDILQDYMITGGMPEVVDEKKGTSAISSKTYARYLHGIAGEWSTLGKSEAGLKRFLRIVAKSAGNNVSWSGLHREADLGSKSTAIEYADSLERIFLISVIYKYSHEKKAPMLRGDRKIHFRDPFFLHAVNGWMGEGDGFMASMDCLHDEGARGKVVEGIVSDHLIRLAFSLSRKKDIFDYHDHVFHWRDSDGKEVDFVLHGVAGVETPVEVKYRNRIGGRDMCGMHRFLRKTGSRGGLALSKSDLEAKDGYLVVPASVFLLLA